MSTPRKALIVGMGIAGMSAAIGLADAGWDVTIVERSPERRRGDYFVGLFPVGEDAARTLGVFDTIGNRTPDGIVTWELDARGNRTRGTSFSDQPGNPASVLRGDIENALWERVRHLANIRFATTPTALTQTPTAATVTLHDTATGTLTTEEYDLVVGADGVRSTVRRLVFGPHKKFLWPLCMMICAFQLQRPLPGLQQHEGAVIAESGRAFWVFPFADTTPAVLFTYRWHQPRKERRRPALPTLRKRYAGMPNEGLLDAAFRELEQAPPPLFDSVEFVKIRRWYRGRVVLTGDAAWCLTLYSGMGATTGLLGGVRLADAFRNHPDDLRTALRSYDKSLRGFIIRQRILTRLRSQLFVPSTPLVASTRAIVLRALGNAPPSASPVSTALLATPKPDRPLPGHQEPPHRPDNT